MSYAKFSLRILLSALACSDFVLSLPLRLNGHPTYINLKMLNAAVVIYKKGLLRYCVRADRRLRDIKMAAQAFYVAEKNLGMSNLPLDPREINRAMKYADKTMSEKKIQAWLDKHANMLFWKEDVLKTQQPPSSGYMSPEECAKLPRLYPHEFFFLISNAIDRLRYVLHHVIVVDHKHASAQGEAYPL
jgi:hypothetical protein